jgi:hypothetical protein
MWCKLSTVGTLRSFGRGRIHVGFDTRMAANDMNAQVLMTRHPFPIMAQIEWVLLDTDRIHIFQISFFAIDWAVG